MKFLKSASIATVLVMSNSANADIAQDAVLNFIDGSVSCMLGADPTAATGCAYDVTIASGSYFGMDTSGDGIMQEGEKIILTGADGITLGTAQGIGSIDQTWSFGGGGGNHFTAQGLTVTGAGNTVSLDMTGWTVFWGGGNIDMGSGTLQTEIDASGNTVFSTDASGNYIQNAGSEFAAITCGIDCAAGDTFTLDYSANVQTGSFAGFFYALRLEGFIGAPSAVPVPAAVWLFGSGLIGLVGFARRKKV